MKTVRFIDIKVCIVDDCPDAGIFYIKGRGPYCQECYFENENEPVAEVICRADYHGGCIHDV